MFQKQHLLALLSMTLALGLCAQCSVDLPQDTVTVYAGYDPLACVTLAPSATGTAPIGYAWSNGDSAATITVCDTISGWYFVTITDADTCSATDSVFVNVVDVHCGNNGNKVLVCHIPPGNPDNAHTICISENGVPAHLAHGCVLGACEAEADSLDGDGELMMAVSPNPMIQDAMVSVRSSIDQRVSLTVVDASGRRMNTLLDADLAAGETRTVTISSDATRTTTSIVWLRLQGASGSQVQRALVLER